MGFLKEASIPLVLQLADAHFFREGQVPASARTHACPGTRDADGDRNAERQC